MRKVLILSASFLVGFSACKEDGALTPDFIENTSFSIFTDSTSIKTQTRVGDSVLADKVAIGLVGLYRDSVFGKTSSSIYVQPLLPSNGLVFGETNDQLLLDSIVLSLEYSKIFGDSSVEQTMEVYRLDEELDIDDFYYSDTSISTLIPILGTKTFKPQVEKQVTIHRPNITGGVDTVSLNAQLRIRLDDALGSEILSKSGEMELSTNEDFTSFFKGLKITPDISATVENNKNSILSFALTASETKMTLYYTSISGNDTTPKLTDFPINSSSVRFSTFQHDYSGSVIEGVLNQTSTDSLFSYTQSMAGIETSIKFPNIKKKFENSNIVINKAELELPVANGSYAKFGVPNNLILASRDESRVLQFIPDFFEGEDFFGGDYDPSSGTYRFNITRYIQGLIKGIENENGLTLLVSGSAVNAERVVFFSENNEGNKIKLNLYYSNTQ